MLGFQVQLVKKLAKHTALFLVLSFMLSLSAYAHGVKTQSEEGSTVVYFLFTDNSPMVGAKVIVQDKDGNTIAEATTNEKGGYDFSAYKANVAKIIANDGGGHLASYTINKNAESGANPFEGTHAHAIKDSTILEFLSADDKPMPHAHLHIYNKEGVEISEASTDDKGMYDYAEHVANIGSIGILAEGKEIYVHVINVNNIANNKEATSPKVEEKSMDAGMLTGIVIILLGLVAVIVIKRRNK